MTKRCILYTLVVLLLSAACPIVALADVIFEPPDSFYERHRSECEHLNRSFHANGRGGYLKVMQEPGSNREVWEVENGELLLVSYTYDHRGETWGVVTVYNGVGWDTGWVPMGDLILAYDFITFEEEHGGEFYRSYSGDLRALFDADKIIFWTWPGSGGYVTVYDNTPFDDEQQEQMVLSWLTPVYIYKDGEGREWGFITYFYAIKNTWICLDDPGNQDIPVFNPAPVTELRQEDTGNDRDEPSDLPDPGDAAPPRGNDDSQTAQPDRQQNAGDAGRPQGNVATIVLIGIIVAVVALAVITALIIRIVMKKRN